MGKKSRAYHIQKGGKVDKICMNPKCRRKFKGFSALSVKPIDLTKPESGICPVCKKNFEDWHLTEEDWNGQSIGEQ